MTADTLLEARGVEKTFPGVRALGGVDLDLRRGEVLAVVGENGAGKSTLMKILAGVERPDAGVIRVGGAPFAPRHVQDAIEAGIVLIHQELNLAGNLDIASNVCLGREPRRFGLVDRRAARAITRRALHAVGLDEPPERRVDELAIGHRQLVEIAKAISIDARVLIMDEPTSSLSLTESERLFAVVRQLRDRGVGVIYISHRLAEVQAIADRVVVLRDGLVSGRLSRDESDRETMVRLMVGRALSGYARTRPDLANDDDRPPRLELRGLRTTEHPDHSIDLRVEQGAIVGIAGLVGAGRTELLEAVFGVRPPLAGTVLVDGRAVPAMRLRSPRRGIGMGLALVPEDRQQYGLIVEQSLRRNLTLPSLARDARAGFVDRQRERSLSRRMVELLRIRAADDRQIVGTLSGGNQQKTVLGKWLGLAPNVLLLDEPTRGVDVGARAEIYRIMEDLAARGAAILFVSSDLEEILAMSDRVLVMRDGGIAGALSGAAIDETSIMRLATGAERAA